MEVKAKSRFIRMSPRKVRLVIDMIRGKKASQALDILEFSNKLAKRPILKLLNSALANAEHNFSLIKSNLYIKEIKADGGPVIKRWTPKAHGRAGAIRKRTSHIEILLAEIEPGKKLEPEKKNNKIDEKKAKTQKLDNKKKETVKNNKKEVKKSNK